MNFLNVPEHFQNISSEHWGAQSILRTPRRKKIKTGYKQKIENQMIRFLKVIVEARK